MAVQLLAGTGIVRTGHELSVTIRRELSLINVLFIRCRAVAKASSRGNGTPPHQPGRDHFSLGPRPGDRTGDRGGTLSAKRGTAGGRLEILEKSGADAPEAKLSADQRDKKFWAAGGKTGK